METTPTCVGSLQREFRQSLAAEVTEGNLGPPLPPMLRLIARSIPHSHRRNTPNIESYPDYDGFTQERTDTGDLWPEISSPSNRAVPPNIRERVAPSATRREISGMWFAWLWCGSDLRLKLGLSM